jgi:hypothetical protein
VEIIKAMGARETNTIFFSLHNIIKIVYIITTILILLQILTSISGVEIIRGNGHLRPLSPKDLETARNSPKSEILESERRSILTMEMTFSLKKKLKKKRICACYVHVIFHPHFCRRRCRTLWISVLL